MSLSTLLFLALAAFGQAEASASIAGHGYSNQAFGIEAELFPLWTVQHEKVGKRTLVVEFGMPPIWSDARGRDVVHVVTVTADSDPRPSFRIPPRSSAVCATGR